MGTESGSSIEDVIDYVRRQMYNILVVDKNKYYDSDSNSEGEEIIEENGIEDIEISKEISKECTSSITDSNRAEASEDKDDGNNSNANDLSVVGSSDEEEDIVPKDYMFPSYYAFILFGPFADPDDRLTLLLTDDTSKSKKDGSRAQRRKTDQKEKLDNAAHDTSAVRGFSTDQRINIESLNVQKKMQVD